MVLMPPFAYPILQRTAMSAATSLVLFLMFSLKERPYEIWQPSVVHEVRLVELKSTLEFLLWSHLRSSMVADSTEMASTFAVMVLCSVVNMLDVMIRGFISSA